MGFDSRHARLKALEALEDRAKQFRGRDAIWPFRVPHEPLNLDDLVDGVSADALRGRTVLRLEWPETVWELWTIVLPSGIFLYCDSDGAESRVLASVKRGSASEADGFFLERLAESRGEFLADIFVELFEGTSVLPVESPDFRSDVVRWLDRVLTAPPFTRRQPRIE